jgi:hypothetical protein
MRITPTMLKGWITNRARIAGQKKHLRHGRIYCKRGQEDAMELKLYKEFKAARAIGKQIGRHWFIQHAKAIYREQYPERIIQSDTNQRITYLKFKFSNGRF